MSIPSHLKFLTGLILALASVYLLALTANAVKENQYIGRPEAKRDVITIGAEGKVTALPDIATTTIGVRTEAKTVQEAQEENTRKMNAIIAALKEMGIDREDISTVRYDVHPVYDYRDGERIDRGFEIAQSVRVKIRDTSRAGQVLAKAGEIGANEVGGLNFTIDDPEDLRQEARLKALENAKEKARALAEAAGVRLGSVVGFSESSDSRPPTPNYGSYAEELGRGGDTAPDIERGSQEVSVNVSVEYEIIP